MLVYDFSWSKGELYVRAVRHISRILQAWDFALPHFHDFSLRRERYGSGGKLYGHFVGPDKIYVNVSASTQPRRTRGRVWSFPGYKVDRTAAGIAAHETGHYLWDAVLRPDDQVRWLRAMRDGLVYEAVSGYEPLVEEAWAETVRLALLNPGLLRWGCPRRYEHLRHLGLIPLPEPAWRKVLANAPAHIVGAATNWIKRAETRV